MSLYTSESTTNQSGTVSADALTNSLRALFSQGIMKELKSFTSQDSGYMRFWNDLQGYARAIMQGKDVFKGQQQTLAGIAKSLYDKGQLEILSNAEEASRLSAEYLGSRGFTPDQGSAYREGSGFAGMGDYYRHKVTTDVAKQTRSLGDTISAKLQDSALELQKLGPNMIYSLAALAKSGSDAVLPLTKTALPFLTSTAGRVASNATTTPAQWNFDPSSWITGLAGMGAGLSQLGSQVGSAWSWLGNLFNDSGPEQLGGVFG